MKHDSELKYFKDMAHFIKKEMEAKFEDSWHVIVGTNFGSFVSYEHKCICLFWLEHIGFLVFKHG
jgi:dynein light chain LC8-type|tara:strand:+ start:202 stop:396 length:195 start_codon:yes stop_codon:yes gene_type:complete